MTERFDVARFIPFPAEQIFSVLRDPEGHVAIDSTGMLQSATGEPVNAVGDRFVVHMDRESLNDFPLGKYDVEVEIITYEPDREIAWTIHGQIKPSIGHVYGYQLEPAEHDGVAGTTVRSYYDWSRITQKWRDANIFPIIPEVGLRATLGILERTVARKSRT
jgi:hypothetical protein